MFHQTGINNHLFRIKVKHFFSNVDTDNVDGANGVRRTLRSHRKVNLTAAVYRKASDNVTFKAIDGEKEMIGLLRFALV